MKYKKQKEKIEIKPKGKKVALKEQLLLGTYASPLASERKGNITVYIGNVKKALAMFPTDSVDCVITSPPYWKQRDYRHPDQIGQEDSPEKYIANLVDVFRELKRVLKPTGTFFLNVGYKYQNKNLLLVPELLAAELQKNGWCLLNKIVWHKPNAMPSSLDNRFSNVYEPVFLFVKEESKYRYHLSLDALRIPAQNFNSEKKPEDLLGMRVRDSLRKDSIVEGVMEVVHRDEEDNIILAEVSWQDKSKTVEIVQNFNKESQIQLEMFCGKCKKKAKNEIEIIEHEDCNGFLLPILPSSPEIGKMVRIEPGFLFSPVPGQRSYAGKFRLSPENRGASPGGRLSLFGEYLVRQRRFEIYQPVIADYLKYWRVKRKVPSKEIDSLLGYKDTAGHWFRKDTGSWGRGGSIPLPEDWFKLKKILGFDDIYDRWVTETHLVLQTVRAHPKGRNPGDIWSIKVQPLPEAHFATFPEELVRRCIEAGCPEDGVVLDPFAGSGTTGKVSKEMGKDVILIELIPDYLNIITKRCGKLTEVIYVK